MNCPRCGSENIRRSQSQDSIWFRFVLQKKMRCQRCCFAFATPVWENPMKSMGVIDPSAVASDSEMEVTTISA